MDQTHIHLIITHLPIFGSILGAIVLAQAIWFKSRATTIAAYTILTLSAFGGIVAFLTGEAAEDIAEHFGAYAEVAIHNHEEMAEITIYAIVILGIAALAGFFLSARRMAVARRYSYLVLLLSLICFGMTSYTGYLGGQIRHIEVHGTIAQKDALHELDEAVEAEFEKAEKEHGRKRRKGRDR